MNAAVVVRKSDGSVTVAVEERLPPRCGRNQLLIEPEFIGICGSDLELLSGHFDQTVTVNYPVVLGHEWAGRVIEVGEDATGFLPGELVVGHGMLGEYEWFGLTHDGAMANTFAVDAGLCFAVPEGVSAQQAAMIEPTACVLAGLRRAGGADAGATAVVLGCGTLGLAMIGVLAATGAAVVAIDPSERRRAVAEKIGAELALPPGNAEGVRASIRQALGASGADLVVEASGSPSAQSACFDLAGLGGRVLFMGISHADAPDVPLRLILEKNLHIFSSDGAEPSVWEPTLRFIRRSGLDLTPAVSHVYGFAEIQTAIATARSPQTAGKVMLRPTLAIPPFPSRELQSTASN